MNREVPIEAINATTQCRKGFSCLTRSRETICKLSTGLQSGILFVECGQDVDCNYRMIFGERNFCTCPTRRAIYDRYGI